MHRKKQIIAALLWMAAQWGQAAQHEPQPAAPAASAEKPVCPARDISFFIQRFAIDETVQRLFTAAPLVSQLVFPVMPLPAERAERALEIRLEEVSWTNARVILFKPDTDYLVSYFFAMDDCWRLVRIDDQSL